MDDPSTLGTVAGLAAVTTALVAGLKPLFGTTGRATHALALGVAFVLAVCWAQHTGKLHDAFEAVTALVNAILAAAMAVGIHQTTVGIAKESDNGD